jgi:hypothetical protein
VDDEPIALPIDPEPNPAPLPDPAPEPDSEAETEADVTDDEGKGGPPGEMEGRPNSEEAR